MWIKNEPFSFVIKKNLKMLTWNVIFVPRMPKNNILRPNDHYIKMQWDFKHYNELYILKAL